MDQKAADELIGIQGHDLLAIAIPVVFPSEADLAVFQGQQSVVGYGDPVGIASDIVEDLCRSRERPPGVDHPLGVPNWRQIAPECGGLMQVAERGEEFQLSGVEGVFQVAQEQTPEHSRQYPDRKEELSPTRDT